MGIIHNGFSKTEIAFRYYSEVKPMKVYNRIEARKQFDQDKRIDKLLVKKIVKGLASEQIDMLK